MTAPSEEKGARGYTTPAEVEATLLRRRRYSRTHAYEGTPCWEWTGAPGDDGYGRISIAGRMYIISRVAAWLWKGLDLTQSGVQVCHHCDHPGCFNPLHLFPGTGKENAEDSVRKGRNVRGSRNAFAKMDEDKAAAALVLLAQGQSQREVARHFGVSQPTIGRIWRGQKWAHVPGKRRPPHAPTSPAAAPEET